LEAVSLFLSRGIPLPAMLGKAPTREKEHDFETFPRDAEHEHPARTEQPEPAGHCVLSIMRQA
jgi:hypothetical protein